MRLLAYVRGSANQELLLRNEYLAAENLSMANYTIGLNTVGANSGVGNPGASAPDTLLTLFIFGCSMQEW